MHAPIHAHVILDAPRPLVFAHRGGAALRPENTVVAFEHGLAVGADGLELDVHLSRDGIVVVCHDDDLGRTTNGHGPVGARTAAELAALDAAWSFGAAEGHPYRGSGIGVPTLQDVLDRFAGVPLVVELKGDDPAVGAAAVALVRAAGALDRVCFGSFRPRLLDAARACGDDVVTSAGKEEIRWALYGSWVGLRPRAPRYRTFQVPECYGMRRIVTRRFVSTMRRAGLPVHVWTVDEPEDVRRLLAWGVAAVISDHPDVARRVTDEVVAAGAVPRPGRRRCGPLEP